MSAHHIVTLPGDGIGPEIMAPDAASCWKRSASSSSRSTSSAAPRSTRTGPRSPTRCSRPAARSDAVLLAAVGGPKWDTTDPASRGPSKGCSACARASACTRTCARSSRSQRSTRPRRCDASGSRARTCSSCASSPGGIYFGEKTRTETTASDLCAYTHRGDRADRAHRLRGRAARRSRASTRPTCSRPRGCGARSSAQLHAREFPHIELEHVLVDNAAMQLVSSAARLRHDRHREHVRRHPLRRGGDAHRLDRDAPQRLAGRSDPSTARPVRARPRLRPGHRRAPARPTRWRCSSPPRCCSDTGSVWKARRRL